MFGKIRRGVILILTAAASILQWKDIAAQDADLFSVRVTDSVVIVKKLNALATQRKNRKDSLFRRPVAALRSNILLPLMNVGAEVALSNRISVEADLYWPWMTRPLMNSIYPAQQNCVQLFSALIGARLWTGRYRLRGHSVGLVIRGTLYDFGMDWKGEQGETLSMGVDYMYCLPLGAGLVQLEFSAGLGYGVGRRRRYCVYEEGGCLWGDGSRELTHGLTPLRFAIALQVPLYGGKKVKR